MHAHTIVRSPAQKQQQKNKHFTFFLYFIVSCVYVRGFYFGCCWSRKFCMNASLGEWVRVVHKTSAPLWPVSSCAAMWPERALSLCPNVEFLYLKNKPQSVMLCFSEWRYTTIQSLGIATNCHYAIYCFVSECLFVLCLAFWVCVISVSTDHQNGYLNNRNRFVKTKPTVFRI